MLGTINQLSSCKPGSYRHMQSRPEQLINCPLPYLVQKEVRLQSRRAWSVVSLQSDGRWRCVCSLEAPASECQLDLVQIRLDCLGFERQPNLKMVFSAQLGGLGSANLGAGSSKFGPVSTHFGGEVDHVRQTLVTLWPRSTECGGLRPNLAELGHLRADFWPNSTNI